MIWHASLSSATCPRAIRSSATCSTSLKGQQRAATVAHVDTLTVEDKLKFAIINGEKAVGEGAHKVSLEELLEEALKQYPRST